MKTFLTVLLYVIVFLSGALLGTILFPPAEADIRPDFGEVVQILDYMDKEGYTDSRDNAS